MTPHENTPVLMIALAKLNPSNKTDAAAYSVAVQKVFKKYGGGLSLKLRTVDVISGSNAPDITMLVNFPSHLMMKNCFESSEYLDLLPVRDLGFIDMQIFMAD